MGLKSIVNKMMKLYERAAGKLGRDRGGKGRLLALPATGSILPFLHNKNLMSERKADTIGEKEWKERPEDEKEVWRRTILLGEKCQPLEFSGVIYYDGEGQRLPAAPRSPLRGQHTFMQSPAHCY